MTTPDFSSFVASESALFAAALADTDPAARVPACPDWTADDLLWHLAEVQWFWSTVVSSRPAPPDHYAEPQRPQDHAGLLQFFDTATRALSDALAAAADAEPCWTWFPDNRSVAFARRRQAHEALIHRVDAEQAAGRRSAVDAELATDGVAEVFDWLFSSAPPWSEHRADGPIGVVTTTDTGRRWLVQVGHWSGTSPSSGRSYTGRATLRVVDAGTPAFSVAGAAADLDLWLWNRGTGGVVLDGDAREFEAVVRSGVQ
jgi:uncharacterized protein (TIGR03083 family)